MSKKEKEFTLYIDGQAVPVSEQVYHAYHYYERKEKYLTYDLKSEQFSCNQESQSASFIPSREDSYERLIESDRQFASNNPAVEEQVELSSQMRLILSRLTENERAIIYQLYYLGKPERDACVALRMSRTTFQRKKKALLEKIKCIFQEIFSEKL